MARKSILGLGVAFALLVAAPSVGAQGVPAPSSPPGAVQPGAPAGPPPQAQPPQAQPPQAQPPQAQPPQAQPPQGAGPWFQPPPPPPPQPAQAAPPAGWQPGSPGAAPTLAPPPQEEDPRARKRRYPSRLAWDDGDPIPAGYEPKRRPNLSLLITGAVLFGTSYLPSLAAAAASDESDDEYLPLAIPFAGPFVTMATVPSEGAGTFWLAVDGLAQVTGASLFVASFVAKKSYLRRVGASSTETSAPVQAELTITPGAAFVHGAF